VPVAAPPGCNCNLYMVNKHKGEYSLYARPGQGFFYNEFLL
jgi:hypothetical protein